MTGHEKCQFCNTYSFSFSFVQFCAQEVQFVERLFLTLFHLLQEFLFTINNIISLGLMFLNDISVVSLTLNFEFHIFLFEVQCILLIQLNFFVVAHFNFLEMLHNWLFGDVINSLQRLFTIIIKLRVLNIKNSSLQKNINYNPIKYD